MKIINRYHTMIIILGIALLLPGVALAAHYAISTTDSSVDDWTGVVTTVTDGDDGSVDDNWDIDQAWVTDNSAHSEMYFRVNFVGSGAFPGCANCSFIEARIDCNRDNDFSDAGDVVVFYDPATPYAGECQGNDWPGCYTTMEINGATFGQMLSGTPNNYEFKADTTDGVSWSSCTDGINVFFATYDWENSITYDSTSAIAFNLPTSVTLNKFSARTQNENQAALVSIIAGALLITGQSIFRRKNN